jgi:hypothetical protein
MLARRTEMSTQNIMIARAIAERLLEAEQAVDAAFEKTASLAAFMPLARLACGRATSAVSSTSPTRRRWKS